MMIRDGVLEGPKVEKTLSMHLWNDRPVGWVGVAGGPVMAGAELFSVKFTGKGGHGAAPHLTIDPIVAAAQVVSALQTITSRNVAPLEAAVVSVTTFHSGTATNIIPQQAELSGTIRTFDLTVRAKVLERFDRVVHGVAEALGCEVEIAMDRGTPAVVNNVEITSQVQETARRVLAGSNLDTSPYMTMGAEDMAFMQEMVPGCYFFIGSNNSKRHLDFGHHHPRCGCVEERLIGGTARRAAAAVDVLKSGPGLPLIDKQVRSHDNGDRGVRMDGSYAVQLNRPILIFVLALTACTPSTRSLTPPPPQRGPLTPPPPSSAAPETAAPANNQPCTYVFADRNLPDISIQGLQARE